MMLTFQGFTSGFRYTMAPSTRYGWILVPRHIAVELENPPIGALPLPSGGLAYVSACELDQKVAATKALMNAFQRRWPSSSDVIPPWIPISRIPGLRLGNVACPAAKDQLYLLVAGAKRRAILEVAVTSEKAQIWSSVIPSLKSHKPSPSVVDIFICSLSGARRDAERIADVFTRHVESTKGSDIGFFELTNSRFEAMHRSYSIRTATRSPLTELKERWRSLQGSGKTRLPEAQQLEREKLALQIRELEERDPSLREEIVEPGRLGEGLHVTLAAEHASHEAACDLHCLLADVSVEVCSISYAVWASFGAEE